MPQDILITPGSGEPQILFRGSGTLDTAVTLNVLSSYQSASRSGTALVFEGTEGQLFAITDNLSSGTIFGVGDVTGLPLLRIDASGDVTLAEFGRFVGVGTGVPRFNLDVRGTGNFSTAIVSNNATFNGSVGVSQNTPGAKMHVNTLTSSNKGLIVQGAAAQSANLQEWQNSAGSVLASIDKDGDITASTGTFTFVQLTSSIPRQSGLLFLDNNSLLNTSPNLVYDRSNLASPKLTFKASGVATPDISLNILTTASGSTSGVQTLSFEGSAGQLFSISDVLNSGTIFSVNDISGLPLIEVNATGLVSLARFGTGIDAHRTINALQNISAPTGVFSNLISGTDATFTGSLRLPTNNTGIYFSSTGNSHGRISTFSNDFYIDLNNAGNIIFRTNAGLHTNLTLHGNSSPVSLGISGGSLSLGASTYLTFDTNDTLAQRRSTNSQTFRIYNTYTDASNYIRQSLSFTTYSSTVHAQLAAEGAGTGAVNVPFVITPRGTGAFILGPMPDGTTTGGNARGANAVDLQTTRGAATQVASGQSSFAAGSRNSATGIYSAAVGYQNIASAEGAFAAGVGCSATSNSTFATGQGAIASGYGSAAIGYDCQAILNASFATGRASSAHSSSTQSHSSGSFANRGTGVIVGGSQHILWTLAASTVPNVATEPFTTSSGGTSLNTRVVVPNNTIQSGIITINGIRSDGGECCHFVRRYAIKNIANTVSQLAAAESIGTDIANGCSIAISANNTTKHIEVLLTAPAARFSGITGSESTDVITLNTHGFVNGEEIAFSGLVGGTGLSNNVLYFVRDVTTNTFKVTTGYPSNTATNFTTDITNGSVDYCWNWTVKCNMEETKRGI